MSVVLEPTDNLLLSALLPDTQRALLPALQRVTLPAGMMLSEMGQVDEFAYFPADCILGQFNELQGDEFGEVCLLGNDGMTGAGIFMGGPSPSRFLVQTGGSGLRLPAEILRDHFNASVDVRRVMLGFVDYWMRQIEKRAACHLWHTHQQQLCHWLLCSMDRLPSTQAIRHDHASVWHHRVSAALTQLQHMGAIQQDCGEIRVLDRAVVERLCCSCYEAQ
ncbi:MAG: hypothetical protein WEB07_01980 [Natronospirillum sp.]